MRSVTLVRHLLFVAVALASLASAQTFLQKSCQSSNCGSCSSGACQCENLLQGSCYLTPEGGSGMAWCKTGHIVLRSFFVSTNCSGPFAEMDTPLDSCYPAQLTGWVEYECPSGGYDEAAHAKKASKIEAVPRKSNAASQPEMKFPGPKFVPHEDSFDLEKHAAHLGVHQRIEGGLLTIKLGEHATHRRLPSWELRVGKSEPRVLGHSTVLNTTQLLEEAKGGAVTLRERHGKSNLYVLRK